MLLLETKTPNWVFFQYFFLYRLLSISSVFQDSSRWINDPARPSLLSYLFPHTRVGHAFYSLNVFCLKVGREE